MISKELRNRVIEMLESGMKPKEISSELKVSCPTIYRISRALGLTNRGPVEIQSNFDYLFVTRFSEDWNNVTGSLVGRPGEKGCVIDEEFVCDFYSDWIQAVNIIRRYYRKPILVTWKLEV